MTPIKTILHPTDFSVYSQRALEVAGAIARDQGAALVVLHVVPRPGVPAATGKSMGPNEAERYRHELAQYREVMLTRLRRLEVPDGGILVEHLAEDGDATERILRTAKDRRCDLIVMGSHGSTGDERALLGSVAEAVSRRAPCPVLTVRLPSR
jgi:nucleotide-binding universal stress UspA family protein